MSNTKEPTPLERIVTLLSNAPRVAVLTGAGMSAESGIPTFRDARSGLWAQFDPERLATPAAYRADKALVWGWYAWRAALVEQASPNAGHLAIATLERLQRGLVVVTQNVDDLHERAGSRNVVHLHGSLFSPRCSACERPCPPQPSKVLGEQPNLRVEPPRCVACGGPIRPGVVWFGEQLPEHSWRQAELEMEACDALLVIGTSGVVQPAASLPSLVKRRGRPVIEINPDASALTPIADVFYACTAADALPKIVAALQGLPSHGGCAAQSARDRAPR